MGYQRKNTWFFSQLKEHAATQAEYRKLTEESEEQIPFTLELSGERKHTGRFNLIYGGNDPLLLGVSQSNRIQTLIDDFNQVQAHCINKNYNDANNHNDETDKISHINTFLC